MVVGPAGVCSSVAGEGLITLLIVTVGRLSLVVEAVPSSGFLFLGLSSTPIGKSGEGDVTTGRWMLPRDSTLLCPPLQSTSSSPSKSRLGRLSLVRWALIGSFLGDRELPRGPRHGRRETSESAFATFALESDDRVLMAMFVGPGRFDCWEE